MITYNHGPFIREAVGGILMQKCNFSYELVIGEDNSSDNTSGICQEYAEKYPEIIRIHLREINLGMMPNFLTTLKVCTGKYIALCEGDDYWTDPNKLQKQVDFLEANEDYGMIHTGCCTLLENNEKINYSGKEDCDTVFNRLIENNPIGTLTVCFRRNLFELYLIEINPLGKEWLMGDYPLWLWISTKSKIKYIPDVTGIYRKQDESVSHSKDAIKNILFQISAMRIREFFALRENKISLIKSNLSKLYLEALHVFYAYQYNGKELITLKKEIKEYSKLSNLNKIRLWGLKNRLKYTISFSFLSMYAYFKKILIKVR